MTVTAFLFYWTLISFFAAPIIGKCVRNMMS